MGEQKPWWQSKTVWGGLVALGAGIAGAFGVTVGAEDQELITSSILGIASAAGGLIAVYGRLKAQSEIKK